MFIEFDKIISEFWRENPRRTRTSRCPYRTAYSAMRSSKITRMPRFPVTDYVSKYTEGAAKKHRPKGRCEVL